MRTLLRFGTHCYLVLAVLAGVPAGASRMVLCLAPNGHVEIEVGRGRCVDFESPCSDAPAQPEPRVVPDGCGECVDVPMGTPVLSEARGRGTAVGTETSVANPLLSAGPAAQRPAATIHARSAPRAAFHSAFPPSRTTILRN